MHGACFISSHSPGYGLHCTSIQTEWQGSLTLFRCLPKLMHLLCRAIIDCVFLHSLLHAILHAKAGRPFSAPPAPLPTLPSPPPPPSTQARRLNTLTLPGSASLAL